MNINLSIQKKINKFPPGRVITYQDLSGLCQGHPHAVAKEMERLVKQGILIRQKPGVFYKPEKSRFGPLNVKESEVLRQFMYENGRLIGYLSGPDAFRALGISTQVSSTITIATPKKRRRTSFEGLTIRFVQSRIKTIKIDDVPKLQLLDVLTQVKKAQDMDVDEVLKKAAAILMGYSAEEKERVFQLAKKYGPRAKALMGAMLQNIGRNDLAVKLKADLNPLTSYKVGVSLDVLPNKSEWSIS